MSSNTHSFSYVQPTIVSLLILSSFIYLLSVARSLAHHLFYAGLIGQILVGMIYARPLANILKPEWEQTILDFGYLGLLLVVFEGGLETRLDFLAVKSNLFLSSVIGITGIITPIGLSIILCSFGFKFNLLESFTMGASLSATSLGTTFAILSSHGEYQLNKSRMGTILVGAALLDDISGLVIASVIEKLGNLGQQNLPWLISKPIVSSIAMIVISALLARLLLGRLWIKINFQNAIIKRYLDHILLFCLISTLSATVTIAAYTGASTLVGAYCCGALLRYLDDCQRKHSNETEQNDTVLFTHVFEKYIKVVKEYIFAPFFFASIGFAVPFLDLWHGQELWQGILYALLMIFGKIITGVWIIIWTYVSPHWKKPVAVNIPSTIPTEISMIERPPTLPLSSSSPVLITHRNISSDVPHNNRTETIAPSVTVKKSRSVYPALLVGLSMVSRGEIGFLIANIGVSTSVLSAKAFIVTIWAILLNTILGPIAVGLTIKILGSKLSDGLWID
ncbi:unnamed protein product [Adineta steineri]|uniref:Cation/H+ exchanger transmembrane domain-containing protein n=2 Tax=Adineta steineri TaxID=433720 RepID=A0A814EQN6_9BILA|nr:unnamed protein product [Adineta steineri]CAF4178288.1 unnamed protein product [Adineta steineri]